MLLKGTAHFTVPAPCLVAERPLALRLVSTKPQGVSNAVNWTVIGSVILGSILLHESCSC